jgi:hypothetical protein
MRLGRLLLNASHVLAAHPEQTPAPSPPDCWDRRLCSAPSVATGTRRVPWRCSQADGSLPGQAMTPSSCGTPPALEGVGVS